MPKPEQPSLFDASEFAEQAPRAAEAVNVLSSVIDNRGDNTLLARLTSMTPGGQELWIATAFFSLEAFAMLGESLHNYERVRILFGDEANPTQRQRLMHVLRERSEDDLLQRRLKEPTLDSLKAARRLFEEGRIEARCYTRRKFHAKAYLLDRPAIYPPHMGIAGSGNFTRQGLTENVELNIELTPEQVAQLRQWYEERWQEAAEDVVTADILEEISRQIELYDPYILYLKALFLWGDQQAVAPTPETSRVLPELDPGQEHGYRRALQLISRQNGCMICDGVGTGKSYIALALMDHYCRQGLHVLLIAPKNILESTWKHYLEQYLDEHLDVWGGIRTYAMTDFGFPPDEGKDEAVPESVSRKRRELERLARAADVVIIDESHNFRNSSAYRYRNVFQILKPFNGRRKRIILLTATPINTAYEDLANQLALITHEAGTVVGYSMRDIRQLARTLDKHDSGQPAPSDPYHLTLRLYDGPNEEFNRILESVLIQRGRKTLKELAAAVGKEVHYPRRNDPRPVEITIPSESARYRDLIRLADNLFRPTANLIRELKSIQGLTEEALRKAAAAVYARRFPGIRFGAFLLEQYRRAGTGFGVKAYGDEVQLAGLIFVNVLKQLESSPVAFQGIIQSLGEGLLARLKYVLGHAADPIIAEHEKWVRTPLFSEPTDEVRADDVATAEEDETMETLQTDGESLDAGGEDTDVWLQQAITSRALQSKLEEFVEKDFDIDRWRTDIEEDLRWLREIHTATLAARQQPDPKLEQVVPIIQNILAENRKLLIFTQSQRTALYLERELRRRLPKVGIGRIDSKRDAITRAAMLYAFCPNYNPRPGQWPAGIPQSLPILISTDVLAEGVNLQDAGAVLSYDIHWNPVRLIQRIGRVDRRIDPAKTPLDHTFDIINILPPREIDEIIELVGAVENRTIKISRTLGLDVSFFKATDPAGTLREFNALADGDTPPLEQAYRDYAARKANPLDPATQALLQRVPRGAFGVWEGAPDDGACAVFQVRLRPEATEEENDKFGSLNGKVFLVASFGSTGLTTNAGEILTFLSQTEPGQRSALPRSEADLRATLRGLRDAVRDRLSRVQAPRTVELVLECWMEFRRSKTS